MDTRQKYVRLKEYDKFIIFSTIIEHSAFANFEPVSAGFCYINPDKQVVSCFGESISLKLKSNPEEDTKFATKQIFGYDAMNAIIFNQTA